VPFRHSNIILITAFTVVLFQHTAAKLICFHHFWNLFNNFLVASIHTLQIQNYAKKCERWSRRSTYGYVFSQCLVHAFWLANLTTKLRKVATVMHDCDWVLITKMKCSVTISSLESRSNKTIHRLSAVICVSFSKKKLWHIFFSLWAWANLNKLLLMQNNQNNFRLILYLHNY